FVQFPPGGGIYFSIFKFHLLGAGITKWGLFQPWIIQIGSPVGAVLYWAWGRKGSRNKDAPELLA
ncbi:MAG: hypothetical protein RLN72_11430, partial [Henriciella sp.]